MNIRRDNPVVEVFNGNLDQAIKVLQTRVQNDGSLTILKLKRSFVSPSEKRRSRGQRAKIKRRLKSK